jgi:hypothetical protein
MVSLEFEWKKMLILKFSYNYVKNWRRNRNRTKENKKSERGPEPCQNGTVPQHCLVMFEAY